MNVKIILGICASFLIATLSFIGVKKNSSISSVRRKLNSADYNSLFNQIQIRPFENVNKNLNNFCVQNESSEKTGIFYIKVPKTSSGTLASVTERIAAKEAKRQNFPPGISCKVHEPGIHHPASQLHIADRDMSKSFLWTVVRHPDARAVSHYGMHISFGNWSSTENEFQEKLKGNVFFRPHTQLWWITSKLFKDTVEDEALPAIIQGVLDQYNFIGIYERLHESVVVLSMLIGASLHDVLLNFRPIKLVRCGSLEEPKWLTNNMRTYLDTMEWKNKQKGDFLLYEAINKKLDLTIERLGKERVAKNLEKYEKLLEIGTRLSSKLHQPGCGVYFRTPFDDINDLKNFPQLPEGGRIFVHGTKGTV